MVNLFTPEFSEALQALLIGRCPDQILVVVQNLWQNATRYQCFTCSTTKNGYRYDIDYDIDVRYEWTFDEF